MSKMKAVYGEDKGSYTAKLRTKSMILTIWFIFLTIVCLLPMYILIINATRSSTDIANGISFIPGTNLFKNIKKLSRAEREQLIKSLQREMRAAAKLLEFEHAAYLRDKIKKLRGEK